MIQKDLQVFPRTHIYKVMSKPLPKNVVMAVIAITDTVVAWITG